jgi:hypothetical protein
MSTLAYKDVFTACHGDKYRIHVPVQMSDISGNSLSGRHRRIRRVFHILLAYFCWLVVQMRLWYNAATKYIAFLSTQVSGCREQYTGWCLGLVGVL